jgi:hypothetical protein
LYHELRCAKVNSTGRRRSRRRKKERKEGGEEGRKVEASVP